MASPDNLVNSGWLSIQNKLHGFEGVPYVHFHCNLELNHVLLTYSTYSCYICDELLNPTTRSSISFMNHQVAIRFLFQDQSSTAYYMSSFGSTTLYYILYIYCMPY